MLVKGRVYNSRYLIPMKRVPIQTFRFFYPKRILDIFPGLPFFFFRFVASQPFYNNVYHPRHGKPQEESVCMIMILILTDMRILVMTLGYIVCYLEYVCGVIYYRTKEQLRNRSCFALSMMKFLNSYNST